MQQLLALLAKRIDYTTRVLPCTAARNAFNDEGSGSVCYEKYISRGKTPSPLIPVSGSQRLPDHGCEKYHEQSEHFATGETDLRRT